MVDPHRSIVRFVEGEYIFYVFMFFFVLFVFLPVSHLRQLKKIPRHAHEGMNGVPDKPSRTARIRGNKHSYDDRITTAHMYKTNLQCINTIIENKAGHGICG